MNILSFSFASLFCCPRLVLKPSVKILCHAPVQGQERKNIKKKFLLDGPQPYKKSIR